MSNPRFHGNRRSLSASSIRSALAEALMQIKSEDELTFADIGRVFGKSEDQAARYCDGTAEMSATALYFGRKEWNGRFTGIADKLLEHAEHQNTLEAQSSILRAALALSEALENGDLTTQEIRANRTTLENARDCIDRILLRLAPRSVA